MGAVAAKMARRAQAVSGAVRQMQRESERILVQGLQEVHDEQLTSVTRLPITGRMRRSIGARVKGQSVAVGYNVGSGAKVSYAARRLKMTGSSKSGGHRLDMNPGPALQGKTRQALSELGRAAQRRIIGGRT